jgi:Putative MetA-pathway of phenol degradation
MMTACRRRLHVSGAGLMLVVVTGVCPRAQELEPRAYSPSPIGTTFVVVTATRSTGGVFTDPAAPLRDVEADIGVWGLGAGRTFGLMGKSALILGLVPVAWGRASGQIGEDRLETTRRGLADPRLKLSIILAGSPAMTRAEFARAPRRPIIGASLTVVPPVGQYFATRLVNVGSNRWSFKPEVGLSIPLRRWTFDTYAAVWIFTDNREYYPGRSHREQDPVFALQGHATYTLAPRTWVAVNTTWYAGGASTVDGKPLTGFSNSRWGATLALPIGNRQSLKVAYSTGVATRIGADFRTITAGWQWMIF